MKKLIFLIIIFASFSAKCDTLDFYHVYLNDSLLAKFNSFSEPKSISLKISEVKETDVITVRHFTDAPSPDNVYKLFVLLEVMEKTPKAETQSNFGKMSISISELLYFRKKYEINKFPFNYAVHGEKWGLYSSYLFTLEFD